MPHGHHFREHDPVEILLLQCPDQSCGTQHRVLSSNLYRIQDRAEEVYGTEGGTLHLSIGALSEEADWTEPVSDEYIDRAVATMWSEDDEMGAP